MMCGDKLSGVMNITTGRWECLCLRTYVCTDRQPAQKHNASGLAPSIGWVNFNSKNAQNTKNSRPLSRCSWSSEIAGNDFQHVNWTRHPKGDVSWLSSPVNGINIMLTVVTAAVQKQTKSFVCLVIPRISLFSTILCTLDWRATPCTASLCSSSSEKQASLSVWTDYMQ